MERNQHPEQKARDRIDKLLTEAGWQLQSKDSVNVYSALGVAVRELHTAEGPADYILFIDGEPVGVIEAKKEEEGFRLTSYEDQTEGYRTSPIKLLANDKPLRFGYESTGELTRFTDYNDPKPRSRPVFAFHKPETLQRWISEPKTLRARLHGRGQATMISKKRIISMLLEVGRAVGTYLEEDRVEMYYEKLGRYHPEPLEWAVQSIIDTWDNPARFPPLGVFITKVRAFTGEGDLEAAGEVVARFTKADEKEFLTRNIAIHPPALAVG
jgi:hypothetical protein